MDYWSSFLKELFLFGRIFLAALLGLLIGLERQYNAPYTTARVYVIFATGTALFTIVSGDLLHHSTISTATATDISRIAGQIVTGIGFICAAFIFKEKFAIRGLTSAVTLWATASIGMAVGYGMFSIAVLSTLFLLVILLTVP